MTVMWPLKGALITKKLVKDNNQPL